MKVKALVEFEFEGEGTEREIKESIKNQIVTDLNVYYQYEDPVAKMTDLEFKKWTIEGGE